jgi:hypothetical protein
MRRLVIRIAAIVAFTACRKDERIVSTAPQRTPTALRIISPSAGPFAISVGVTIKFGAVVLDQFGDSISHASPVQWTSSDPSVASVSTDGSVTALHAGRTVLHAAVLLPSQIADSLTVTVVAPAN